MEIKCKNENSYGWETFDESCECETCQVKMFGIEGEMDYDR